MIALTGMAQAQQNGCAEIAGLEDVRAAHLQKLNAIRSRDGLGRLSADARLNTAAQAYACLLARTGHFDHVGPDGSTLTGRASAAGYDFCLIAENIAKGQRDVDEVLRGWVKSPGHLENIRRRGVVDSGFGAAYATRPDGEHGALSKLAESVDGRKRKAVMPARKIVWVELFGKQC